MKTIGNIMQGFFEFSIKRLLIALICFLVLFFGISHLFHLPLKGESGLRTEESPALKEVVNYISDNNVVIQSLYFRQPIVLHSAEIYSANWGNTVTMSELQFYIMDKTKQTIYSSSIPAASVEDNEWLHLELGDVELKANQKYFLGFHGAVENESVVCPTFYMMENNSISNELYVDGVRRVADRAICATYEYDVLPMGVNTILFFGVLFVGLIVLAMLKPRTIRNNFIRIPSILWMIFWSIFFLSVAYNNYPEHSWMFSDCVIKEAVVLMLLILLAVILNRMRITKDVIKRVENFCFKYRGAFGVAIFVLVFVIQYIIVDNIYQKIGWDVRVVWDSVTEWMNHETPTITHYYNMYPNNIAISILLYLLRGFVKGKEMAEQYHFVVIVNVLLIDLGIFMTYKAANRLLGFRMAVISMIWCIFLFGFTGWIVIPYTDTMTFWIPITILYLFLLACEKELRTGKRFAAVGGIGFLSVLGYYLKPQCIIILIAILFVFFCTGVIKLTRKKKQEEITQIINRKKVTVVMAGLITGLAVAIVLFTVVCNKIVPDEITTEASMPMEHFFMMGLNENPSVSGFGSYCDDDVNYTNQGETTAEKRTLNRKLTIERLTNFGVAGFINHLYQKGTWILGDGTLYWQGEGSFWLEDYSQNDSQLQKKIREKYYNSVISGNSDIMPYLEHMKLLCGIWYLTLFFVIFAPFCVTKRERIWFWIPCLAILGAFMFTLLFEGRTRYLINYIPLFALVAAASILGFAKKLNRLAHKGENT